MTGARRRWAAPWHLFGFIPAHRQDDEPTRVARWLVRRIDTLLLHLGLLALLCRNREDSRPLWQNMPDAWDQKPKNYHASPDGLQPRP
ncbi:hypothetical protein BCV69DRAFT_47620 [Microstroma glucosiphilum]|uniref:Uncharacterized protein n=1 Tax=Pseudomicrostroma glucosiphilum TaxID=1684307 RepID=A0A316U1W6_9BASI|nr:hypothetical protein BCV69DRAFT_47620 [Pseudomicrostroma glucosiphilum]PWN19200.1 hypothetical protein BCV69DRAFT_47620 [Pseudomicrostroma glucosiphilum]